MLRAIEVDKKERGEMKCPQKLDKDKQEELFKQPKGLAVCEAQEASPFALP